jgi:hypothetical protein
LAANLIASGRHRDEVCSLFKVNSGTLYRAVPKAMVDEAKAKRLEKGQRVASAHKPRSGRPPDPEGEKMAAAFLKVAHTGISPTAFALDHDICHTKLLRALRKAEFVRDFNRSLERARRRLAAEKEASSKATAPDPHWLLGAPERMLESWVLAGQRGVALGNAFSQISQVRKKTMAAAKRKKPDAAP